MTNWGRKSKSLVASLLAAFVLSSASAAFALGMSLSASGCLSFLITICAGPTYDLSGGTGWHFTASIGIGIPTGLSGSVMVGNYSGSSPVGGSATIQGGLGIGGAIGTDGGLITGAGITSPGLSATLNRTW